MKKGISFILLMAVFIYIGGYHWVILLHQSAIKKEIKAYLKTNKENQIGTSFVFKLVNNEIQDPNFRWEDNKAEFIYNHEWYDVIDVTTKNQEVIIYALKDGKENELEKQLGKLKPLTKSSSRNIQSHIKFSYFEVPLIKLTLHPLANNADHHYFLHIALSNGLTNINIPPPKSLS